MNTDQEHSEAGHSNVGLLTLSQVAAIFGVEASTVARWAHAGKLTAIIPIRPGATGEREWCFAESEVRELIDDAAGQPLDVSAVWAWAGGHQISAGRAHTGEVAAPGAGRGRTPGQRDAAPTLPVRRPPHL